MDDLLINHQAEQSPQLVESLNFYRYADTAASLRESGATSPVCLNADIILMND